MQPTNLKIDQPWLLDSSVEQVMQALSANGGMARFVGGCVRDALFHRPIRDIDIATDMSPDVVIDLLSAAELKYAPTGLDHGTITAIADGRGFEVTTLRHDVATDGRRATVAFTDDWLVDAERRDFTMNALYCDADGTVYDPVGGIADIAAKRVRFIGTADDRITEDYLRILRFFRFHAWYGDSAIDEEGLQACIRGQAGLATLSIERICAEIMRLLEAADPVPTLATMTDSGILACLLPAKANLSALERVVSNEQSATMEGGLRRFFSLFEDDVVGVQDLAKSWKLSNKHIRRIKALARKQAVNAYSEAEVRAALYRHDPQTFIDNLLVWSQSYGKREAELMSTVQNWVKPIFPLGGSDVMSKGVKEGQKIGAMLGKLEEQWIEEDFTSKRDALLARLDALIAEQ